MSTSAASPTGDGSTTHGARPVRSAAWLTADSLAGWDRRQRLADAVAAATHERDLARHHADVAAWELERLRARLPVRLGRAFRTMRREGVAAGLRALRRVDVGERPTMRSGEPTPPPLDETPFAERDRYDHPHLRVAHLGTTARFSGCAPHRSLEVQSWASDLGGDLDLLVVEPPSDGLLPTWAAEVVATARDRGLPVVVVDEEGAQPPAWLLEAADLHLRESLHGGVEGARQLLRPPTVDASVYNPVGWRSVPADPVIAVITSPAPPEDTLRLLEAFDPPVGIVATPDVDLSRLPDGLRVLRRLDGPDRLARSLRRAGVVLDHPDLHDGPTSASRLRAAAAACGTCVLALEADVPAADLPLVVAGDDVQDVEIVHRLLVDTAARERLSIAIRRHALTARSHTTGFNAIVDRLGLAGAPQPLVSVVVATNRPDRLEQAVRSFVTQRYQRKELVLVLHGPGFPQGLPDFSTFGIAPTVLRIGAEHALGACLNAGIDVARGSLIAKMDDDDHYGPDHLGDLVLAQGYSGADLVGKRIEYVHVAAGDVTVRRPPRRAERFTTHVSGPTLLFTADVARRIRFRPLPRRVDSTLCARVAELGGRIYRTHPRDVVLERHDGGHTWDLDTREVLDDAVATHEGLATTWASSCYDPAGGSPAPSDEGA